MAQGIFDAQDETRQENVAHSVPALLAEIADLRLLLRSTADELFDLRYRAGCGPDQPGPDIWQQNERLREALQAVAKMKPEMIADGFVHGPALLLANCKRLAREALRAK